MKLRPYLLWLPVWVLASLVVGWLKPGVFSNSVHWAESVLWSLGYTGAFFFPAYWLTRLVNKDMHPGWRVLVGLAAVAIPFAASYGR